jgi:starch synthase
VSRVLMVSPEASPYAKTGGLADVAGSLPLALKTFGDDAALLIPRYGFIELQGMRRAYDGITIHLGPASFTCSIFQAPGEFPFYLLDCPELYDREGLYGESGVDYPDNHIRFAVLCRGALEVSRRLFSAEIFHCHDWQTGLAPAYLNSTFKGDPTFLGAKTLFTIHNLGYQGLFPKSALAQAALDPALFGPGGVEFYGNLSFIKAGIALADAISTVSPTYAREIQTPEFGFGLDGFLRERASALTGILNGADYAHWNPETDALLEARYSPADLSGKRISKERLIAEVGLPPEAADRPLLGVVSRLTPAKVKLILDAREELLAGGASLVALGTGDPECEKAFREMAADYPAQVAVRIGFDNGLAHRVIAGADIFLMPSRYEPCGLTQMYALKYGTVPVVRATGGLDDTIDEETGIKFTEYSGTALADAVREAVEAFGNSSAWRETMLRGMAKDYSWNASAAAYSALYRRLLDRA